MAGGHPVPGKNNCCGRNWCVYDACGIVCGIFTWLLLLYGQFCVLSIMMASFSDNKIHQTLNFIIFEFLFFLACASHLKTMFTDPGAVPKGTLTEEYIAQLEREQQYHGTVLYKCTKCACLRPEKAHHCSVCKRCIRRMDHHCPWVNNCVGENNQKCFVLFTFYISSLSCQTLYWAIRTYIQLMKFVRRTEGVKQARLVFKRAREDTRSNFHVYVAAAFMEYYCSKEPEVAKRIFDLGLKKHGDDPEYALAYVEFLSHLNEDTNTRVVFERMLNSENALPLEKSSEIWDKYLEFESQVGDLTSVLNVDQRRRAANPENEERMAIWLIDRYKFLNLTPCTPDQLKLMGYSMKNLKHTSLHQQLTSASTASGVAGPSQFAATLQNGRTQSSSNAMGFATSIEMGGFPRPDTSQMLPFKPRLPPANYHPVAGGTFPYPLIVSQLLQALPPPRSFTGPYVDIEELMKSLANFNREPPRANMKDGPLLDPNASFDGYRAADVKKEFYQLLNTTTDPLVLMASQDLQHQQNAFLAPRKRTLKGESDSEDDEVQNDGLLGGDLYKKRMHNKSAK